MVIMSDNLNENNSFSSDNTSINSEENISSASTAANDTLGLNNGNMSGSTPNMQGQSPQSGTYSYIYENQNKPKKAKKHNFLKAVAFVLCLAIVGVGSIQGYKIYQDSKDKSELSEFDSEKATKESTEKVDVSYDEEDTEEMPSLIQLASRGDAKPIPDIVDSIMPSVVGVSADFEYTQTYSFFGWNSEPETYQARGTGTGFIISEDGYIVTNAHVIYDDSEYKAGEAIDVSIMFSDETEHEAKIIAYDTETDIAVLKVDETGLTPAVIGNSDELRVGELVIAVGNPLGFDLFGSVTSGIVSALNRQISINERSMSLIQTDAPINSGNSGGPLLNSCGQVIGINSAKMSSSYGSASVEGLGFAIPISDAKKIIDDLIHYKYVKGRPQLGLIYKDVTESYSRYYNIPMGVYVTDVIEDGAGEKGDVHKGDIIIGIEDEVIKTTEELNAVISKHKVGDTLTLTVYRGGEDIKVQVVLSEADAPDAQEDDDAEKDADKNEAKEENKKSKKAQQETPPVDPFAF